MTFDTLEQAKKYLEQFIKPSGGLSNGKLNFGRMKQFMDILGNPQNTLKVIHVAGTSGKGSTCYAISSLLHAHGFKVGLTISPHMIDLRERTQINNQLLSESLYCIYLSELVPAIEKMHKTKWGAPSYFEITMAHAFYTFAKEKVDYAVIETGLGGRYDASNVVTREDKIAAITRIGLDHMDFLGNTIAKIAEEKAHIIQSKNRVLSVPQDQDAQKVIERIANEQQASLKFIFIKKNITTSLLGDYQHENLSLAIVVVYELAKRDKFNFEYEIVTNALMNLHVLGRFEVKTIGNKTIILDGAHNPQKMEAFTHSLSKQYPDKKFDFLIAFKKEKDYQAMLKFIVPLAQRITVTEFGIVNQGMLGGSDSAANITHVLKKLEYTNYEVISDTEKALKAALQHADKILVITGSLYLISNIYKFIKDLDN
ncbi:folylpolyglutamate synthase/dihydrofolate synthase family protein [soil metagenome]